MRELARTTLPIPPGNLDKAARVTLEIFRVMEEQNKPRPPGSILLRTVEAQLREVLATRPGLFEMERFFWYLDRQGFKTWCGKKALIESVIHRIQWGYK